MGSAGSSSSSPPSSGAGNPAAAPPGESGHAAKHRAKFAGLEGFLEGRLVVEAAPAAPGAELPAGSKRVHFIRHGEGFHNLFAHEWRAAGRPGNPNTDAGCPVDPELTEKGIKQAEDLGAKVVAEFPAGEPQFVFTSPMRRAVLTGLGAFKHKIEPEGLRFVATDLAHEEGGLHRGDLRLSKTELAAQFPQVDFSGIEEEDPLWSDTEREAPAHMAERSMKLIELIMDRPEDTIAVAAHSSFLLTTFNICLRAGGDDPAALTRWFETGEMRTVHLRVLRRPATSCAIA